MQRVRYILLVIQHGGASEERENDEVFIYLRSAYVHTLNVERDLVYAVIGYADPRGLEARGGVGQWNRPRPTVPLFLTAHRLFQN